MNSSISNSFWDIESTGLTEPFRTLENSSSIDNYGLTSDEMKQSSSYVSYGWDFENIWDIDPGINNGFPFLRGLPNPIVSEFEPLISISKPTFEVLGNYPNPFNPETTISFSLESDGFVNLDIFNIRGQKIRTLIQDYKRSGEHQIVWNGKDENKNIVGSGVYFYQLTSGEYSQTKRMILMK